MQELIQKGLKELQMLKVGSLHIFLGAKNGYDGGVWGRGGEGGGIL